MHNVLQPVFGHNDPGDSTWMTIKDTVKTGAELFLANDAQIDLAEIAQNEVHIDEPAATTVKGTHMLSASRYTYSLHWVSAIVNILFLMFAAHWLVIEGQQQDAGQCIDNVLCCICTGSLLYLPLCVFFVNISILHPFTAATDLCINYM